MSTTIGTIDRGLATDEIAGGTASARTALTAAALLAQLLLALAVVYVYSIEGAPFLRVFAVATVGFAVNLVVPAALRLPFFVLLSLSAVFLVFSLADGLWLIASGLTLIGLCHLPIRFGGRVAVVIGVAALLAASRGGLVTAPWSAAVWPILGSMFMFRLVIYMMDIRKGQAERSLWSTLGYFFMLPNLVFPLFPVVDYTTFNRTHYDRHPFAIYEQGLLWITRGLVHLALYRFIYHSVLLDPVDVRALSDLVQFMLGTFLLYLRVSGQFHLIVGLLHLFGFRLPETHKLYYLASSFTELWRRINIYWTEFMMKTVFYPCYFKVKRLGPASALVLSTAAVFIVTWLLHSYQWFWLRGGFPLTMQDTLFWGILGALVVRGAVQELRSTRKPRPRVAGWNWRLGLKAAVTFSIFCFLWSLWSAQSMGQWVWMLGAAGRIDARGLVLLGGTVLAILALGGYDWEGARNKASGAGPVWARSLAAPAARTVLPLVILLGLASPVFQPHVPESVVAATAAMRSTGLNAQDAAAQHRGYYEQLDVRAQLNGEVMDVLDRGGKRWDDPASVGIIRVRQDILERDLHPLTRVNWNGRAFSTNSWGMRDQEYAQTKPGRTLRIALLGPSHVMGNGVADGETFEALIERRLSVALRQRYDQVEILNFGVDGYTLAQQVAILEDRVLSFAPDIVIATHYHRNREMTETYLSKVIWGGIDIPHEPLRELLRSAGLFPVDRAGIPIPFEAVRRLAQAIGVDSRMPSAESASRIRWISARVMDWSFDRFAHVSRAHGIVPVVLALNAVVDDAPLRIPGEEGIRQAGLQMIDLFDVFPAAHRPALRVAPWDDHPNAEGHRLVADRLYPEILDLVGGNLAAGAPHGGDTP